MLAAQNRAVRQWANNKLKIVIASTAARFRRVRAKMAADRAHADALLQTTTARMSASLNAEKALRDVQFAKTVKDIAAAKSEAKARVKAARTEFKVGIRTLKATVDRQVAKTNNRITALSVTVEKNKVSQAKVNSNVNAETKRMIKLGTKRYAKHLKNDAELTRLVRKNKAATDKRLNEMAAHFAMELNKVRKTMKKNRAHATHMLTKETSKLFAAIAKGEKAQAITNQALSSQTRQARMDITDALNSAKSDFGQRLGALHSTVVKNDKKFEKKMDKLTGIVRSNAVKSAKGRAMLANVMKANKEEMKAAVSKAVHIGEARMTKAEAKLKKLNSKTKASMNMRITSKISSYAKAAASQIEGLRLSSKAARSEMKKEMLYAIRSAAAIAKQNLDAAAKDAAQKFGAANKKMASRAASSAAGRAKLAAHVAADKKAATRSLKDAVTGLTRSLLALKVETSKKVKKTNHKVDAYAVRLASEAKAVDAAMKANVARLSAGVKKAKNAIAKQTSAANTASAARGAAVLKQIASAMSAAKKASANKFGKLYKKMAGDRKTADENLQTAVVNINDKIAKQAALADARFSKTVKDLAAAKAEATAEVGAARKAFATSIAAVTAAVKDQETRLAGEIQVVSGEVISTKASQLRVNRRTQAELKRIAKIANERNSRSMRARGKLRATLNMYKRAAHEEVVALDGLFTAKLAKVRKQAASDSLAAARDLTKASAGYAMKLGRMQLQAVMSNKRNAGAIAGYSASSAAALKGAKTSLKARLYTLADTVASNQKKFERGLEVLTGVQRNYEKAGKADRALLRAQTKAMGQDLNKRIVRAIQIGEAKARKVANRARVNLSKTKKALLVEIAERVEATADKLFKTIQGNHKAIADNYLSLKAYAITAKSLVTAYVVKGKGKNLSSMGDLLNSVASLSAVVATKQEGIGAGASKLPSVFNVKSVKVHNSVSKINGLVNEYASVCNGVRMRNPMGLGKYLLMKAEASMLGKGILQVDKVSGKAGNWVFVNGRAIGLSNKLKDFESLAVRMAHYEGSLAKLTASLSGKAKSIAIKKPYRVAPPEYQGK